MRRPDRHAGPTVTDRVPSWRATLTLVALSVLPFVADAVPTAVALVAAAITGTVGGVALHRRYPDAVDRVADRLRLPAADEPVPADG